MYMIICALNLTQCIEEPQNRVARTLRLARLKVSETDISLALRQDGKNDRDSREVFAQVLTPL